MDLGLKDKVVFVAGSSRGIGLAAAVAFLNEGARVVLTGRSGDALERAVNDVPDGSRVVTIAGDLTVAAEAQRSIQAAVSAFGGIDVLVANVGSGHTPFGWDIPWEDWQASLTTNLSGSMMLARSALPHLIARRGNVIFVSSIAGVESIGSPIPYAAAKAALGAAMKALARQLGPEGVRVNAVAPGNVFFPGGVWDRKSREAPETVERLLVGEVPMRRFARPEEIADVIVFLASERASFITGSCVVVDGGQTRSL